MRSRMTAVGIIGHPTTWGAAGLDARWIHNVHTATSPPPR
jgi:hypothetical protein